MRKAVAGVLVAIMLLSLCGCDSESVSESVPETVSIDQLYGTWEGVVYLTAEETLAVLEDLDFFPEEIALADLEGFTMVKVVEFSEDNGYRISYDLEASNPIVKEYLRTLMHNIYENREGLTELFGDTILDMSKEEFFGIYASMFWVFNEEGLLYVLTRDTLKYDDFDEYREVGLFRLESSEIMMNLEGEGPEESLKIRIDGENLILCFADGEEVFTRK